MKEFDASDFTFPSVTGEHVESSSLFLPRPRWQRNLSWLVRRWRYPREFKQSAFFNLARDKTIESTLLFNENGTIRVVLTDHGKDFGEI